MGTLRIDLQDGFDNDDVRIKVNGKEVYHRGDVTTKLLLGLADTTQTKVDDGAAEVEVAVPSRGLSQTERVEARGNVYLGVSVEAGRLRLNKSETPFGYA
jgi:hypothetical protein